jgi:hypothetical protein
MAMTSTELLEEGMELEAPIKNHQGQVLFGVGHKLKAKHIDMLLAWGITEADVKVEEDSEAARRHKEAIEREEAALLPRFKRCDPDDAIVKEVIRYVAEYQVETRMKAAP